MMQYFDWQMALSLGPEPPLTVGRAAFTVSGFVLGAVGSSVHRTRDPRRWRAVLVLLLSGSVGVMLYLNLKAGPSIGWGILPDSAPHEPRERDYFFVLAFWAWGIWVAIGAADVVRRGVRLMRATESVRRTVAAGAFALVVLLPTAFNWKVVERRSEPSASLPRVSAQALLASTPSRAVLFVAGDNDSYPLWYLQHVEGFRRDVTVITIPIIPARWYQDELQRRHRLRAPDGWAGLSEEMTALANSARRQKRPVAAAVTVQPSERQPLGDLSVLRGWVWVEDDSLARAVSLSLRAVSIQDAVRDADLSSGERSALVAIANGVPEPVSRGLNVTERYMAEILACPRLARESATRKASADSLDSTCNFR
jgi:hypothetical protein